MTGLPDEIWSDILDYLDPLDLISCQRVSHRLLKLARDSPLWRNKVFEKAPSAAHLHASRPSALSELTGALGGLSLGGTLSPPLPETTNSQLSSTFGARSRGNQRAKAVLEWDSTHTTERFDWYTEYVARHAPLSTIWAEGGDSDCEVRGMALLSDTERVVGSLDDGSIGVWSIQATQGQRRNFAQIGKSRKGLLFQDMYSLGEPSLSTKSKSLGAATENISLDSNRNRAFVAVENILNEVDLDRMEVVAQNKFAWHITALSQGSKIESDLTVGTSFSLHIHDPRLPFLNPTDNTERLDCDSQSRIAFLENWTKGSHFGLPDLDQSSEEAFQSWSPVTNRIETYAKVEPGPQSILYHGINDIVIAGRMPSIIFYDRRSFPKPRTAIYSGARLSSMTTLPVPPAQASMTSQSDATLIACGEYGGRGSLELYELPWDGQLSFDTTERDAAGELRSPPGRLFSLRNRQQASSSKLLSVATQGTRIVFSDSEGMLKWVERDGHGLARRWNINAFQMNERGASISGDKVVRKMSALPEEHTTRGARGDGDLLVWTGERLGIVTTKPKPWDDHDELLQAFEGGMDLNRNESSQREKEAEYANMMRQALERQADERRWMSRFGGRRW